MKRFEKLLTQNQDLRGAVSKINVSLVLDQGSVPPKLRLPLSQLDGLLHANDIPPSTMYPYMEQVRQLANGGNPKIQHIGRQVGEYQSLLQTLMRDKPGFMMLANEMRVRRFMDVSKKQATDLARTDREGFFVKLFGRGLSKDEYLLRYKTMFEQLGESHRLRIRLAAFVIPGLLFGYFFSKVGKADEASHQQ